MYNIAIDRGITDALLRRRHPPPSEARSYILQMTYGCSHNRCTFCGTYLGTPFSMRETSQVMEDIELARSLRPDTRRVFLADGDALALSANRLTQILDALNGAFPHLERVGIYANAKNILGKSIDELKTLQAKGLGIVYLGLESGDDEGLARIEKAALASTAKTSTSIKPYTTISRIARIRILSSIIHHTIKSVTAISWHS